MIPISSNLSSIIAGKEKTPIGRVEVFDTSFTVPSSGMYVRYCSGITPYDFSTVRRAQFEPIIMKDWSNGLPIELSQYVGFQVTNSGLIISDPFSVSYTGYFYADSAGLYKFATRSTGGTELYINNIQVLSGYENISPNITGFSSGSWPGKSLYWDGSAYLNTGWYNFQANFYWNSYSGINNVLLGTKPFFTAFYTAPNQEEQLISASRVNIYPEFIQPTNLTNVMFITEDIDDSQSTDATFEVSVPYSGVYTWNNQREDFGSLKINRLCNIYLGYATISGYNLTSGYTTNLSASSDFVKKFTGFIDNIKFDQTKDSVTATVKCRDFFKKFINGINENYPNPSNYLPSVVSNLDRLGVLNIDNIMPNAYDNWSIFDTIENIALNAGIDPSKINKGKWDTSNHFKLESNLNWPYTSTYDLNGIETKNGDPFIFKFEYGEKLFDEVKRVSDLVGYNCFFDETGDLVLLDPRRTNRIEVYQSGGFGIEPLSYSGYWETSVDINTSNRFYVSPIVNGQYTTGILSFGFSGVGFGVYQFNHASGNKYRVDIYRNSPYSIVSSNYYTNSGSTRYNFKTEITRDLAYDGYTAYIYPSGDVRIEGFEYYTQNIYKPVYIFSEDTDITNISIDLNDDIVRNEVIAVGQQVSDKGYLYSKAIDLDSISNPDSFNYIGEKRTFTLIEPSIQSQKRLDWLSSSILDRFKRKQRNIQVSTQGIPHIQIGDPVGIKSSAANLNSTAYSSYDINNNEVYYVNKISSKYEDASYTTTFSLTSLKPIDSWRPGAPITTNELDRIYRANNNTIFNNFRQLTHNAPSGMFGYDGFSEQAAFVGFDLLIDVDRLWVLVADRTDGGEIFKFIDTRSKNPLITYQSITNQTNQDAPQGAVWLHNGGGERWGNIVVPTAQNNFNGGQWIGQNSEENVRENGIYPIAIWAQFKTADNINVFQGIWVPPSGTIDNRSRTLSNTSTNSGNLYYIYTNTGNEQLLLSPNEPSVSTAYLPGFNVNSTNFTVEAWIGPIDSGYQIIASNLLNNLSGRFDFFGDKYSPRQISHYFHTTPHANITAGRVFNDSIPGPYSASYNYTKEAADGPFNPGYHVLRTGYPGNLAAVFYNNNAGDGRYLRETVPWVDCLSWQPQGFDYVSGVPAYVKTDEPGYTASPLVVSGIENIVHELNYFTITANHDFYLYIETCTYVPVTRQVNGVTLIDGFTEKVLYAGSFNQATRGPLATYVSDKVILPFYKRHRVFPVGKPLDAMYVDKANYPSYHGTYNVFYPKQLFQDSESWTAWLTSADPIGLTKFVFTESKSNRKYYFVMRWGGNSHGEGILRSQAGGRYNRIL